MAKALSRERQNNRRQELPLLVLPQSRLRNQVGAGLSDIRHGAPQFFCTAGDRVTGPGLSILARARRVHVQIAGAEMGLDFRIHKMESFLRMTVQAWPLRPV